MNKPFKRKFVSFFFIVLSLCCLFLLLWFSLNRLYGVNSRKESGGVFYRTFPLSSRFGERKYECSGLCYCEEVDSDDNFRRNVISGGKNYISLLIFAVSSVIAFKQYGDYLEGHCEKELSSSCSPHSIHSEVFDCQAFSEERCETNVLEDVLENDGEQDHLGKTYAVTGATGTIGFEIARKIASENPSNIVYIIARDERKAKDTVEKLKDITGNENIYYEIADLSLKGSVQELKQRWGERKMDVLVNNHVICPIERIETEDGIEMNMACNILGYFWLIEEFKERLHESSYTENSRIVNVVSYWAGGLDIDDLEFQTREYTNVDAYFQCKQAERMLTQYYAQDFKEKGKNIDINSSMSGDVDSKCSNDLDCPVPGDPGDAARTPFEVAVGKLGRGMTGEYFRDCSKRKKEMYEKDISFINELYQKCKAY